MQSHILMAIHTAPLTADRGNYKLHVQPGPHGVPLVLQERTALSSGVLSPTERGHDVQHLQFAPLSQQERTALSSSVLSPTQSALSSLPSDKLVGRNMEGKKLRRHVLRGAVVVFVTAGYSGKKCVPWALTVVDLLSSAHDTRCCHAMVGTRAEAEMRTWVSSTFVPSSCVVH